MAKVRRENTAQLSALETDTHRYISFDATATKVSGVKRKDRKAGHLYKTGVLDSLGCGEWVDLKIGGQSAGSLHLRLCVLGRELTL